MAKKQSLAIGISKNENFSEWYTQVIQKSGLIEYTDVSGCMVFRPRSYQIWEQVQAFLDKEFKLRGVKNAYFPLFIPEKLLTKESDHVEGFAPEVAWVTHGGNTELTNKLAIRPTSETIMYDSYAKWIKSHRDLPLKINQWCSVVRWEFSNPVPFLRTREFLWQEGHTVFATKEEAEKEVYEMLDVYEKCYSDILAVPVIKGIKTDDEKFAGADFTLTCETILPNSKAIQGCTSHHLGQKFAEAFGISFKDGDSKDATPYQNSWGFTTRSIGVMIMMHSDDKGLVIPPNAAYNKGIIIPINDDKNPHVIEKAKEIQCDLADYNLEIDTAKSSPGFKFANAEIHGYPFRIELGPKDIESGSCIVVRRDTLEKETVELKKLKTYIKKLLVSIHDNLLSNAKKHIDEYIVEVKDEAEFNKVMEDGKVALAPFADNAEACEAVKEMEAVKTLCKPFDSKLSGDKCVITGKKATSMVLIGRSY